MTRFLPLTRGGWPAEVLCEVTVGEEPLCVKHMLPNGNVAVEMHLLNGWYYRGEESPYDLIPAPEPSAEAYEAAHTAYLKDAQVQESGWVIPMWVIGDMLCAAYAIDGITPQKSEPSAIGMLLHEIEAIAGAIALAASREVPDYEQSGTKAQVDRLEKQLDGITPQQQPARVAELEAEVAKLTAEVERYRGWEPSDGALAAAEHWNPWRNRFLTAFRHDFPDAQPGTGEQA